MTGLLPAGFPHSDIKGSMPACGSPLLFAACHVLLRRLVPLASALCSSSLHYKFQDCLSTASILRLITTFFPVKSNSNCNWSSKTSFCLLSLCAVVKVRAAASAALRFPFENPENDTDEEFQLIPVSNSFLFFFFTLRFLCAIDLRFEASGFPSACSLERR